MRTTSVLELVLLFGACSSAQHPVAPGKYVGGLKEVPGLSLRGNGCHVELLDSNGSVICVAIAFPIPKCAPMTVVGTGTDGGIAVERFSIGSDCPAPRFTSGVAGAGGFFVEGKSGEFSVICDDASQCRRSAVRDKILECCRQDKSIQETEICRVAPADEGVCSEVEVEEGNSQNAVDGGRLK